MNIIELAKEAGFEVDEGLFPFEAAEDKFIGTERVLESFAALVRAEREWVNLTDAELNNLWIGNTQNGWLGLFRAVIAADREKNRA